jgi:hypothetical protein
MLRKPTVLIVSLLAAGFLASVACNCARSQAPLLRITRTGFPSCITRVYAVTPTALTVTKEDRVLLNVPLNSVASKALLNAISNAPLSALDALYQNPNVEDGFELAFQFYLAGKAKTVVVRNRYIPTLFAILDECNNLLPPETRFTDKRRIVEMNEVLDDWIADYTAKTNLPPELRGKVIAELKGRKVKIEE